MGIDDSRQAEGESALTTLQPWWRYVPFIAGSIAADCRGRSLPWTGEIAGTLAIVDVSGFTALSERLAQSGPEGAERLTDVMNAFFGRMLKTAADYDGETLAFAGDAAFLLFAGRDHATRAAEASNQMLAAADRMGAVAIGRKRSKLGMSIGVHSGSFLLVLAGVASQRLQLFVLGPDAEMAASAEDLAKEGTIVVSEATAALLTDSYEFEPVGDCFALGQRSRRESPRRHRSGSNAGHQLPDLPPSIALSLIPATSSRSTAVNHANYQVTPEHRTVSTVFINLLGATKITQDKGIERAAEELQRYVEALLHLCAKHNGFLVSTDVSARGLKLIVTFGAPVAHEYAAANAARFVLELAHEAKTLGLRLEHRIGLNAGHVFAGEVGPSFRRQYTVMGDDVNVAARLMAAADRGQILVSRTSFEQAGVGFRAKALKPVKVKGKSEPIAVCELQGESGRTARAGTVFKTHMFGRARELAVVADAWEKARTGRGQTVIIEGEAGIGKTRLVEETVRAMVRPGRLLRTACYEHMQLIPFAPWVDGLSLLLDAPGGLTGQERTVRAERRIGELAAEMTPLSSLLNPLLGLNLERSDLVRSIDVQTQRSRLFDLITRLVVAEATRRDDPGLVILAEDVHWSDESSLALLRRLSESLTEAPLLLLLTARPTDIPLKMASRAIRVDLGELEAADTEEMLVAALCVSELPRGIVDALYAKTRGNPLFLEEVIHALRVPGVLDRILAATSVTLATEIAALRIPDRIQGLLMSRIDALASNPREVLKSASVAGRSFDLGLLTGLDDTSLHYGSLREAVDELVSAALVVPEAMGDDNLPFFSFRHALVQEVAYESLPYARRRQLHDKVARYLEATQQAVDHGVLVHHYSHSGNRERTRFHALEASHSSAAVYSYREAVEYLRLALETIQGRTAAAARDRSRVEELLGDRLETLARHEEAFEHYRRARDRWRPTVVRAAVGQTDVDGTVEPLSDPEVRDSVLCWKMAVSAERGASAYRRAVRWLDRAAAVLPQDRKGTAARILITRSVVLSRIGRFSDSLAAGEEGLALARANGDTELQAYALAMLTNPLFGLGLLGRAIEGNREAVELYEQIGDLTGQGSSHGNLAACYQLTGNLRQALEHHELALALHARLSYTTGMAITHNNLGELLLQMGRNEAAVEHLERAVAYENEQGVPPSLTGFALVNLSRAQLRLGQMEAADHALAKGRDILRVVNAKALLLDAAIQGAELQLASGELAAAQSSCQMALADARAMGANLSEAQTLCLMGRVSLAQGDAAAAQASLEASATVAERSGADYERAQALFHLAEAQQRTASTCTDTREENTQWRRTLDEAMRMFGEMGAEVEAPFLANSPL